MSSASTPYFFLTQQNLRLQYIREIPKSNAESSPLLVFLHGHQESENGLTEGAMMFSGVLKRWAAKGFFAAAISQPGYGESKGPADFCGPKTQDAIAQFLKHFGKNRKVILWGFSRGAVVAAMIAAKHGQVDGLILIGGVYDLEAALPGMPPGIVENLNQECGLSPACLDDRSALKHLNNFKSKTLIVHGEKDDRSPFAQAKDLHAQLLAKKISSELRSFPERGHSIPVEERNRFIDPFIESFKK